MAEVEIFWSNRARTDLEEIINYISQDSPMAARNFATKIIETTSVLQQFPTVGRIVPEFEIRICVKSFTGITASCTRIPKTR